MSSLYIRQKVFSAGGRFTVDDELGNPRYTVTGTFLQIPKRFVIENAAGVEVAEVTKTTFSFLPRFTVDAGGYEVATIRKEFSFFKPRYSIDGAGLTVEGDWWDMRFSVLRGDVEVARVGRKLLTWADTYEVDVLDESLETIVVALVVAIDRVRADESASTSVTFS